MAIQRDWAGGESLSAGDSGEGVFTDRHGASVPVKVQAVTKRGGVIFKNAAGDLYNKEGAPTIRLIGPTTPYVRPDQLEGSDLRRAVPHAIPSASWRSPFTMRGALRAIAPEYTPGPGSEVFKLNDVPAPPETNTQQWALTGNSVVPQSPTAPVVLINDRVPLGNRLRLTSFLTMLGPSVAYDTNYIWRLQVGGFDLWNPFSSVTREGRPNPSDAPVLISPQLLDLPVFGPGTPIIVTVTAQQPIAASDIMRCVLFGTLWGDR